MDLEKILCEAKNREITKEEAIFSLRRFNLRINY